MEGQEIQLQVESEYQGVRIDKYVSEMVPDLSRSYVQQLIEEGHIRLNNNDVRVSTKLRTNDLVVIKRPETQTTDIVAEDIPLNVVYEDDDILVIDKPAGMVVHPAPGHQSGTVVNAILWRYPDLKINGDARPGIVHRIDRDTSGLLVIARNDAALHNIQEQQQARTMHKAYLLVAQGRFKNPEGTYDAPIARHPSDRLRMAVVPTGRTARTHWKALEDLGDYTLLEARLETGRTHQIRVHFSHRAHYILGDPLYAPRKQQPTFGLNRQFLHAYQLGFKRPSDGEWIEFQSPLPEDLAHVLEKLRVTARSKYGIINENSQSY